MKNKNYISREILIRYLNGELPDEEAWKVEKAMQEDPFLAEAMEGMEMAKDQGGIPEDLEALERRISIREKENEKTIRTPFLKIAAVILVLAVSVTAVYELFFNTVTNSELAMQKNEVKKDSSESATYNDAGTVRPGQQPVNTPQKQGLGKISESKRLNSEEKIREPSETFEQPKPATPENETPDKGAVKIIAEDEEAAGNVTAMQASPIITDSARSVEITPRVTSATDLPAAASGDMAARALKKESRYPAERKAKSQPFESSKEVLSSGLDQCHPLPGDSAYLEYIKSNLQYPAAARQHNIEGDVTVEFTVNLDSSITNFNIMKGIGSGCNEEAIRLIRQGPKWVPQIVNGKPVLSIVVYKITFKLNNQDDKNQ